MKKEEEKKNERIKEGKGKKTGIAQQYGSIDPWSGDNVTDVTVRVQGTVPFK